MEVHQIAFLQAVALACAVSFGMTGCDSGQEEMRAPAPGTQIDRAMVVARGVEGVQSVGNEMSVKK